MANRKATFAKRQRETELGDLARAKAARRTQKRNEIRETKGPQIAWDEAVHAVTTDELPSLATANQRSVSAGDAVADPAAASAAPTDPPATSTTPTDPAAPRRTG